MPIYGNLCLCFIWTSKIYSPLTGSIHHALHSYHIPINATQSHHFTAPIILYYCQDTHPPDHMIHLDPRSWPPACAMGIPASMPTAYHYNHLWPIHIPTHSIPISRITTLLELLDWTLKRHPSTRWQLFTQKHTALQKTQIIKKLYGTSDPTKSLASRIPTVNEPRLMWQVGRLRIDKCVSAIKSRGGTGIVPILHIGSKNTSRMPPCHFQDTRWPLLSTSCISSTWEGQGGHLAPDTKCLLSCDLGRRTVWFVRLTLKIII